MEKGSSHSQTKNRRKKRKQEGKSCGRKRRQGEKQVVVGHSSGEVVGGGVDIESSTPTLSMPATSRSKRFRAATTVTISDRKTRSKSLNSSNTNSLSQGESATGDNIENLHQQQTVVVVHEENENDGGQVRILQKESAQISTLLGISSSGGCENGKENGKVNSSPPNLCEGLEKESMKNKSKNTEEEETEDAIKNFGSILDSSQVKCEKTEEGETGVVIKKEVDELSGYDEEGKNLKDENNKAIRDDEEEDVSMPIKNVSPSSHIPPHKHKEQHTIPTKHEGGNNSSGASGKNKLKIVEERKTSAAPMLLMNNLPYMGELTFDTRPRRGRKPKKADICQLISKNYGIHFPLSYKSVPYTGPPTPAQIPPKAAKKKSGVSSCPATATTTWKLSPSSSTLSTGKSVKVSSNFDPTNSSTSSKSISRSSDKILSRNALLGSSPGRRDDNEPLNLCVRDASIITNSSYQPNTLLTYAQQPLTNYSELMNLKLPLLSPNLFNDFHLKSTTNKIVQNISRKRNKFGDEGVKKFKSSSSMRLSDGDNNINSVRDSSLVNKISFQNNNNINTQVSLLKGMNPNFKFVAPSSSSTSSEGRNSVHKSEMKKTCSRKKTATVTKCESDDQLVESHAAGSLFGHVEAGSSSSGAQVSICKFKFTGGAKPSLQEKKMLSVDSGGNFRFYTDKDKALGPINVKSGKFHSNIQNSTATSSSPSRGENEQDCQYAFSSLPKSAKSMSVCMPCRPSSSTLVKSLSPLGTNLPSEEPRKKFIHSATITAPVTPTAKELNELHLVDSEIGEFPLGQGEDCYSSSQSSDEGPGNSSSAAFGQFSSVQGNFDGGELYNRRGLRSKRKRRTRKSVMREKLEKTFKEKGFLIQTQQLESAEGATYCKFRQLRKFTRYLFRSWKDYLPDNVKEINPNNNNSTANPEDTLLAGGSQTPSTIKTMMELDEQDLSINSQDVLHSEDEDEEDETRLDLMPEVTLITQPSTPATIDDVETDDELDVENVDEGAGQSDNSSPPRNVNQAISHGNQSNEHESSNDSINNDNN